MINRIKLIAYSLMCGGEYNQIVKFIQTQTPISDEIMTEAEKLADKVITIFDTDYPKCLLELRYPPFALYYKGNKKLLSDLNSRIAIVGSRLPVPYSIDAVKLLCNQKKDKVIVSGLAKGIDACAHENANKTIAVLGCGIDYIYPQENAELFKKIEKEGLILSEYPNNTKPLSYHFPFRNRIIAGLVSCTYVAECKQKSGTMTAISEALELGRDVKVLPFDVFTALENNVYNNMLINEGAMIWDLQG